MAPVALRQGRLLRGRRRSGRQPGLLGPVLVLAGLLVSLELFVPGFAGTAAFVFGFWPVLLVASGVALLVRRPGWMRQLGLHAPSVAAAAERPWRLSGIVLVALGVVLLPFTVHLLDERILGAALLVLLGAFLIWRRVR